MSVFFIDNPSFYGFRVQRQANGQVKRRFYSLVIKTPKGNRRANEQEMAKRRQQAEAYDLVLARWQLQIKEKSRPAPTCRNNTGVRGIRFGMTIDIKRGRRFEAPSFIVSCADSQGRSVTKSFRIRTRGYQGAWEGAVSCLAELKGLEAADVKSMLKAMPKASQYPAAAALLDSMRRSVTNGHGMTQSQRKASAAVQVTAPGGSVPDATPAKRPRGRPRKLPTPTGLANAGD